MAKAMQNDFPLADSLAARMLAEGLERAKENQGLSIRQIGRQLGYKQAVVLSHMASGRTPIPIDRAEDLAIMLELSVPKFLRAVVEQRHPAVDWNMLATAQAPSALNPFAAQLEVILGIPLDELNAEQRRVLREVASDRSPGRRWLSVHEMPLVESIRRNPVARTTDDDFSAEEIQEVLDKLEEADRKARDAPR